jgi:hypothetical protein
MYPVQSINSLFLPRFNNFTDVNSLASMDNRPYLPYKVAPIYQPIAYSTRSHSSLPSGVANYDRLAIRDFDDVDSVYSYRQSNQRI